MQIFLKVLLLVSLTIASSESHGTQFPIKLIIAVEIGENREKPETALAVPLTRMVQKLKVNIEYFYCPWARCLQAMENGDVDLLDKLYLTRERQVYIEYLSPAYLSQTSTFRFYSHAESDLSIRALHDLHGKAVGVVRSAVYFPDFDYDTRIKKVAHVHLSNVIELAAAKRIDVLIAAPEFTTDVIHSYPQGKLLAQQPFEYEYARGMYIGLSKNSAWYPFANELNTLLQATIKDLETEHFSEKFQ